MNLIQKIYLLTLILGIPLNLFSYNAQDIEQLKSITKSTEEIDAIWNVINKNQKVDFTSYYEISDTNILYFLNNKDSLKTECLLKVPSKNKYWITKGGCEIKSLYTLQEIIDKKLSIGVFSINNPLVGVNSNNNYFVYSLNKSYYSSEAVNLNSKFKEDDIKNSLILKEGNSYKIIKSDQFSKIEMFKKDLLEKEYPELNNGESLKVLALMFSNYKDYINNDFLSVLKEIKLKSLELTNNKNTDEEKILVIYDWILSNIKYDPETNKYLRGEITEEQLKKVSSLRVQTPIWTFKDKLWVCEWIASLIHLMVQFSGITGAEYEIWGAFSEKYTLHAWNKIWNYYFDATYDLTSGNKSFYKLPKELFFTHRELNNSNEEIKSKIGKEFMSKFKENLTNFKNNNPNSNYSLMNLIHDFKIQDIKNIFWNILDINQYWQFIDNNWNQNRFSSIQSYKFTTEKDLIDFSILHLTTPKNWALGKKDGKLLFIDLLNSKTEKELIKWGTTNEIIYDNLIKTTNSFSLPNKPIILSNDSFKEKEININIYNNNNSNINSSKDKEIITKIEYPEWYIYKGQKLKNNLNSSILLIKVETDKTIKVYTLPNNLLILNKKLLGELSNKELTTIFEKLITKDKINEVKELNYNLNEKTVNTELKMQKLSSIYFRNNLFNNKLNFKEIKDLKNITIIETNLELKDNFNIKKVNNKKWYIYKKGEKRFYEDLSNLIK